MKEFDGEKNLGDSGEPQTPSPEFGDLPEEKSLEKEAVSVGSLDDSEKIVINENLSVKTLTPDSEKVESSKENENLRVESDNFDELISSEKKTEIGVDSELLPKKESEEITKKEEPDFEKRQFEKRLSDFKRLSVPKMKEFKKHTEYYGPSKRRQLKSLEASRKYKKRRY